jgi:hypothetical protein
LIVLRRTLGLLDENPKLSQLEDDRFSRMEHFYGADDIDPETLEDLELGDDGKVIRLEKTRLAHLFRSIGWL